MPLPLHSLSTPSPPPPIRRFRARYGEKLCAGQRSDLCDISDAFTRWQEGGGYRRHLATHKEFRVIERMATLASQR